MTLLQEFKTHIESHLDFLKEKKLLIAISGGIDSVVLTHLCHRLGCDFALAHCNFNLRGDDSIADENFVIELAENIDVEVFTQGFNTQSYAKAEQLSIQMAARELRYNWFKDLLLQLDYDIVLTAHHADDNLETFLINFIRGTGLNGLTGIPPINDTIVRPLLPFTRQQLLQYAETEQLTWREDNSNASRKYLRNKLRHEVVPILKTINPNLIANFQDTLDHLNDSSDIVKESVKTFSNCAIVSKEEEAITYNCLEFKKLSHPKAYIFEVFKHYGFTEWHNVLHLLDAESGKYVDSKTHRLTKHRDHLILTANSITNKHIQNDWCTITILEHQLNSKTIIESPEGIIEFQKVTQSGVNTKTDIYVDYDQLAFPLQIRVWASKDSFQPIGMRGKKRVSKYLKDEKLSPLEKNKTMVLTTANDTVIWVIGKRADNRFKLQENTNNILKISYR